MPTQNDIAWKRYIAEKRLPLDGRTHRITANDLKTVTGREPRLMTKFDTPEQLPSLLRDNGYAVMAITNGEYLLFKGSIFFSLQKCKQKIRFQSRVNFPLVTVGRGTGESEYLDNAFNSGVLAEFTQSKQLYLTIRGRERTRPFRFKMGASNLQIDVDGVQIEADAGYEGINEVVLIEAKIGAPSHFNIRQLYYPFRHFSVIAAQKRIRTLLFEYDLSAATYTFYEFSFDDLLVFDSIRQTRCCVYSLVLQQPYKSDELLDVNFETTNSIVPQANDLNKIFELLTLVNRGQNTVSDIADYFAFEERQSNYYGEAAEYLGLLTRNRGVFELTARGVEFIATSPERQQLYMAKLIINSWIFRELIVLARHKGFFTRSEIQNILTLAKTSRDQQRYTKTTVGRRCHTIVAWVKWLSEQFEVFNCRDNEYHLA